MLRDTNLEFTLETYGRELNTYDNVADMRLAVWHALLRDGLSSLVLHTYVSGSSDALVCVQVYIPFVICDGARCNKSTMAAWMFAFRQRHTYTSMCTPY